MSFDIYIGNAALACDYEQYEPYVERAEHPDAPSWPSGEGWPDISEKTNGRHPGYGQMANWARHVGLYDFWFAKPYGLLSEHPGCFALKPAHLATMTATRERYEAEHPDAKPGWTDREQDCSLARLIWYEWWMKWALDNCERPAVANS